MKVLVLIFLLIFGIYLFIRAQKLISYEKNDLSVLGIDKKKTTSIDHFEIQNTAHDYQDKFFDTAPVEAEHSMIISENQLYISDELSQVINEYNGTENIELKYQYLLVMIDMCFKKRKQIEYVDFGSSLIYEFLTVVEILAKENKINLLKGLGHMRLSALLVEKKEYSLALDLCGSALGFDLDDGTVTGFSGRIKRITKLKEKNNVI